MELITNIFYFFMGVCVGVYFYAPVGSKARRQSKGCLIAASIGMGATVLFVVVVNYCDCDAYLVSKIDAFSREMERVNRRVGLPSNPFAP